MKKLLVGIVVDEHEEVHVEISEDVIKDDIVMLLGLLEITKNSLLQRLVIKEEPTQVIVSNNKNFA